MLACVALLNVCVALRDTAVTMPVIVRSSRYVPRNKHAAGCSTAPGATRSASQALADHHPLGCLQGRVCCLSHQHHLLRRTAEEVITGPTIGQHVEKRVRCGDPYAA